MTEYPGAAEWAGARGERWCSQVSGMEAMLEPVHEPLIRALQLDAPLRIADIGCGGGGTTLEILRRAPRGSVVHGFDISPALIGRARERIPPDERAISFEVADIATAKTEEPYDRLASRFSVMFFDHPETAFANLARWLAPDGRFAFVVWGRQAENPWMTIVREAIVDIIEIPTADPSAPGPFRYADGDSLVALLDRTGFNQLELRDWRGTLAIGGGLSAAEAAHFALASFGSLAELLTQAGEVALEEAHQSLTARFSRHQQDSAVLMNASVHIVTGTLTP